MRISDVMTANPTCCTLSDMAQAAARVMKNEDTGVVPVIDNQQNRKLVGIVTDRDLCMGVVAEGRNPNTVRLEECMTSKVVSCRPDDDLEHCLELMRENQVRRIPIVDNQNCIVGIVSMADVVRRGEVPMGETRETLEQISQPTGQPSRPRAESQQPVQYM